LDGTRYANSRCRRCLLVPISGHNSYPTEEQADIYAIGNPLLFRDGLSVNIGFSCTRGSDTSHRHWAITQNPCHRKLRRASFYLPSDDAHTWRIAHTFRPGSRALRGIPHRPRCRRSSLGCAPSTMTPVQTPNAPVRRHPDE